MRKVIMIVMVLGFVLGSFLFCGASLFGADIPLGGGGTGISTAPISMPNEVSQPYAQLLIPVVVPLLIALKKKVFPCIPPVWFPLVAIVLGALADVALQSAGIIGRGNPLVGALLGAAGIGCREMLDQVKKLGAGSVERGAGLMLLAVLPGLICIGCVQVPQTKISATLPGGNFSWKAPKDVELTGLEIDLTHTNPIVRVQAYKSRMNPDVIAQTAAGQVELLKAYKDMAKDAAQDAIRLYLTANGIPVPAKP